ncbi:hypothetical protein K227x_47770 [Rubripirellula lacrimiformis]|uniref:Uncharacterized protein n=1 Tax=Rubripirellula lacrimiformis TaxID=1930273 RepID=A0A517NH11_9BACT|nr:hypothetical protein [Rubripirellula lacrimiformis]QDT06368.1 hypothetical protein K227x_47770 [Rubripirellula lacrimiformis]
MTQMLLFDATTEIGSPAIVPVVPTMPPTSPKRVSKTAAVQARSSSSVESIPANRKNQLRSEGGVQHMGDLARLVLLRYELAAKRREEIAARRKAR